jgi:hypothetical protein
VMFDGSSLMWKSILIRSSLDNSKNRSQVSEKLSIKVIPKGVYKSDPNTFLPI